MHTRTHTAASSWRARLIAFQSMEWKQTTRLLVTCCKCYKCASKRFGSRLHFRICSIHPQMLHQQEASKMSSTVSSTAALLFFVLVCCTSLQCATARTRHFEFNIGYLNVTRLCRTKTIVAVNGQFPGPTIRVHQGDKLVVKVTNLVATNVTIHWHGVRQVLSAWSDGPAYITQCPIQTNRSFTHRFTVGEQVGTLFWHAHISWLRGTVYGAFIIDPARKGPGFPFPLPFKDETILLGEWSVADIEEEERTAIRFGGAPALSDSYTFNGQPGPLSNCSARDTHKISFVPGRTYLLRVINAALEQDLFFAIANHSMTIVEIDASYTKPMNVVSFMITPGQTVAVLVTANQQSGRYYMAAAPFQSGGASIQPTPGLAIIDYISPSNNLSSTSTMPMMPLTPAATNTGFAEASQQSLRSLNSKEHPADVPQTADRRLVFAVSLALKPCPPGIQCQGPSGQRFSSSINNVTFAQPSTALLQAYYNKMSGVYTGNFPDQPPRPYNYSAPLPTSASLQAESGTRLSVIRYGANVQLVLQATVNIAVDTHPFHLHGFDFYIVGQGKGNFNATRDEGTFNLVDPPRRNTALIPSQGWVALRFKADNPGVWLLHCHLDGHVTWGMEMAFIVKNGRGRNQTLPPPPKDLPKC